MLETYNINEYYNIADVCFVFKNKLEMIKEDNIYVPRFSMKNVNSIEGVLINKPLKPTIEIFEKAINLGMIFSIVYKGEHNQHFAGKERVIYPMVIGKSAKNKILLRGYHLEGWSISEGKPVNKIWRMFRFDRILSITFLGSFYRLPPKGYVMDDKGMRGGIIKQADFNNIRKNQQKLIQNNTIENVEDTKISSSEKSFSSVEAVNTESILNLKDINNNEYISNLKNNIDDLQISFLKEVSGNRLIAMLNAYGKPGNTVKLLDGNSKKIGIFKILDSSRGKDILKLNNVKGNAEFEVYIFEKKK